MTSPVKQLPSEWRKQAHEFPQTDHTLLRCASELESALSEQGEAVAYKVRCLVPLRFGHAREWFVLAGDVDGYRTEEYELTPLYSSPPSPENAPAPVPSNQTTCAYCGLPIGHANGCQVHRALAPVVKDDAPFVVAPADPELVATMQAAQDALMSPAACSPTASDDIFAPDVGPTASTIGFAPTASREGEDWTPAQLAKYLNDNPGASASIRGPTPPAEAVEDPWRPLHWAAMALRDEADNKTRKGEQRGCDPDDMRRWAGELDAIAAHRAPVEAVEAAKWFENKARERGLRVLGARTSTDPLANMIADEDEAIAARYRLAAHSLRSQRGVSDGLLLAAKYDELLFAVGMKHPNETRHETALRYIRQAENSPHAPEAALKREGA